MVGKEARLALHWRIDSKVRLVTVTAAGFVTAVEFAELVDAVLGAGAIGYAKLFDGSAEDLRITREDLLVIGANLRSWHSHPDVGPLAIVLAPRKHDAAARLLGILAAAPRPMRLFTSRPPAERWIAGPVERRS